MLPGLLFSNPEKMQEVFDEYKDGAGAYFYVLLCKQEGIEPVVEDAKRSRAHTGQLNEGVKYLLLEYPAPPPVHPDMMKAVLAPYFSVILFFEKAQIVSYYILGQGFSSRTTFRTVTKDGTNANLGEGCTPDLDTFLTFLRDKLKDSNH